MKKQFIEKTIATFDDFAKKVIENYWNERDRILSIPEDGRNIDLQYIQEIRGILDTYAYMCRYLTNVEL